MTRQPRVFFCLVRKRVTCLTSNLSCNVHHSVSPSKLKELKNSPRTLRHAVSFQAFNKNSLTEEEGDIEDDEEPSANINNEPSFTSHDQFYSKRN